MATTKEITEQAKEYLKISNPLGDMTFVSEVKELPAGAKWEIHCIVPEPDPETGKLKWTEKTLVYDLESAAIAEMV